MRAFAALLLLIGCASAPQAPLPATLRIVSPAIVVASPDSGPDSQVAAYVRIRNHGAPDRLVSIACACAAQAEIHNTYDRQMHTLESLDVPSGDFYIRPGGPIHLMLMDLNAPLITGQALDLTLTFEDAGAIVHRFDVIENSREAWAARSADAPADPSQAPPLN